MVEHIGVESEHIQFVWKCLVLVRVETFLRLMIDLFVRFRQQKFEMVQGIRVPEKRGVLEKGWFVEFGFLLVYQRLVDNYSLIKRLNKKVLIEARALN